MSPIDLSGSGGALGTRLIDPQSFASGRDKAARAQSAGNAAPVAPVETRRPVVQPARPDPTLLRQFNKDDQDTLMLRSQALSLARQEEMRLEQKLTDLRTMIEKSETDLRDLQKSLTLPPGGEPR